MNQTSDEQALLRRYLLRHLDEAEQEQIEERLLTDKEFGRRVHFAQDDLIDDYVAGELSAEESESFRKYFLTTPERVRKLRFASALDRYVDESEPDLDRGLFEKVAAFFRAQPLKAALTTAAVLAVVGVTALFIILRPNLRSEFVRANVQQAAVSATLAELRRSTADTVALDLRENVVREDAASSRVEVAGGVTQIRLLLEVTSNTFDSYRAVLQTSDGRELAAAEGLRAREENGARFVVVNVPARFLERGAYQVRLVGVGGGREADAGLYPFEVTSSK